MYLDTSPLRKMFFDLVLPVEVTAGSRATDIRELRQARKGAAVTVLDVCREGAWLSLVSAILFFCHRKKISADVCHDISGELLYTSPLKFC